MTDGLSEGDIVLVDFSARTEDGDLFDTTDPELAKDEGWDEPEKMAPMPVLLGGGRLVPGFEEALLEAEIGEQTSTDVPPSKGFGEHDADQVRVFPRKEFEKADIDPIPGNSVEINDQRGFIVQATASRVRVDFNHPMAGKTLTYDYKVIELVEDPAERLKALIGIDYQVTRMDAFDVTVDGSTGRVEVPEEVSNDPQWFMAKHRLGHDVFEHTDLDEVELVEVMERGEFEAHDHGHGHAAPAEAEEATDEDEETDAETEASDDDASEAADGETTEAEGDDAEDAS